PQTCVAISVEQLDFFASFFQGCRRPAVRAAAQKTGTGAGAVLAALRSQGILEAAADQRMGIDHQPVPLADTLQQTQSDQFLNLAGQPAFRSFVEGNVGPLP